MYKYKAFISYRHIPFDSAVAERVMRLIETFTPPRSMHKNGKFEKWRCFRDEEELPLSKNLGDDIHEALRNSEFLIIICSPEYNESQWCLEELRYFKEIHEGSTSNIAVISISGEPSKTFPDGILSSTEGGKVISVEPLSADIRADTARQSLKKLNTLYLKMIARFLGCEYNDLVQRQEKRKRKRIMILSSVIISVLLAFIVVLPFSYTRIQSKNKEIEEQNYSLQIENAKHLALESEILWSESKPLEAIKTVLQAVPSDDNPIPMLPEVSFNLTNQIGAYRPINFQPVRTIDLYDQPQAIMFSSSGETMITEDGSYISFWNTDTGELIQQYYVRDLNGSIGSIQLYQYPMDSTAVLSTTGRGAGKSLSSGQWVYDNYTISESTVQGKYPIYYYHCNGELYCFDEINGDMLWKIENVCQEPVYAAEQIVLVVGETRIRPKRIIICDHITGEIMETYDVSPLIAYSSWNLERFDAETHSLLFNTTKEKSASMISAILLSGELMIGEEICSMPNAGSLSCEILEDIVYISAIDFSNGIDTSEVNYILQAFDLNDGHRIWRRELSDVNDSNHQLGFVPSEFQPNQSEFMFFSNHDKLLIMNPDTGATLHQFVFSNRIIDIVSERNGILIVTTANGEEIAIPVNEFCSSDNATAYCALLHQYLTGVSLCCRVNDKYAVATQDTLVYLYKDVSNPDYRELLIPDSNSDEYYYYIREVDPMQRVVKFGVQYKTVDKRSEKVLSLETGEICDCTDEIQVPSPYEPPEWFPKDEFSGLYTNAIIMLSATEAAVIVNDYEIRIYNCETGEIKRRFDISNNEIIQSGFYVDDGESILLVGREGGVYKVSALNGEIEAENKIVKPQGGYCDEIQYIDEQVIIIIEQNIKKYAWILNMDDLSAQYYIEDFEYYDEENGVIYLFEPYSSRLGTVPVYSTEELVIKAEQYLSGDG